MENILHIIELFKHASTASEFSQSVGTVNKTVGNRLFLTPHYAGFKAISVMTNSSTNDSPHDMAWVGVTLNFPLEVNDFVASLDASFELKRNPFDDETVLVFKQVSGIELHCILMGDVNEDALELASFQRLKLIKAL